MTSNKVTHDTVEYSFGECIVGPFAVSTNSKGICGIILGDNHSHILRLMEKCFKGIKLIESKSSDNKLIQDVASFIENPDIGLSYKVDIEGTNFQIKVWNELRKVPTGSTTSYTRLAQQVGNPKATRAVANACGSNRLAIYIPCHRVLRSDGGISGYRFGVQRKKDLLRHEAELLKHKS